MPRVIRAALLRLDYERFRRIGFDRIESVNASPERLSDPARLDLATVAFDNPVVISEQIRLLRKNLRDPFDYTVADNSPDAARGAEIREICSEQDVPYLRLPRPRGSGPDPSTSHGWALNWMLAKYIRPRGADYFGFIDHDVFPIRPTEVIARLRPAPAWGLIQERAERWYLWPGLSFFDARRTSHAKLDFRPGPGVDTGGRNWESLYSGLDRDQVEDAPRTLKRLREGDGGPQSDHYEEIGDWLHTYNASHWLPVPDRDHLVADLIRRY
jgi:hypothetical protein